MAIDSLMTQDIYFVCGGAVLTIRHGNDHCFYGDVHFQRMMVCSKKVVIADVSAEKEKDLLAIAQEKNIEPRKKFLSFTISLISGAIMEIMRFSSPETFIVESQEIDQKISPEFADQTKKIHGSPYRPIYLYLTKKEIRRKFNIDETGVDERLEKNTKTVSPHKRRRHLRTLKSAVYKKMLGKIIVVREAWIGPSDAVINNRRYRVILDR